MNDNCNPQNPNPDQNGIPQNPCYYNSTQLTVAPGQGGSPPSANSPAVWLLTDPLTGQAPTFASFQCNDTACSNITVTATSQPSSCSITGNVQARVTLSGNTSAPFPLVVDWPQATAPVATNDVGIQANQQVGYLSIHTLQLVSQCKNNMFYIYWHEEFPTDGAGNVAPYNTCNPSPGWTDPIPQAKWGAGTTDAGGILQGNAAAPDFDGIVYACGVGVPCNPPATIPGPLMVPPQPLNMTANAWSYQFIFVGSQDTNTLGKYWTTAPNKQVRYTDHGRDELGTWSCPGQ